jgi:hypothetical protein
MYENKSNGIVNIYTNITNLLHYKNEFITKYWISKENYY